MGNAGFVGLATITKRRGRVIAVAAGVPIVALALAIVLLLTLGGGSNKTPRGASIPAQDVVGSIGDSEPLRFDPVNGWAATLILAAALDLNRSVATSRRSK